jgi:hypothetical protein
MKADRLRYKKDFPYLYISKDELQAIPNDTLKKLVTDYIRSEIPESCVDRYFKQGQRLQEEQLRRQEAGLMEPPASWAKHEPEIYNAWFAKHPSDARMETSSTK